VFLLTNILAVPLSTCILFAEILLLIVSGIPFIAGFVAVLVEWSIRLMNELMLLCNQIPFAIWKPIYANRTTTILLYALVICVCYFWCYASKAMLKFSLVFLLLFNITQTCYSIYFLQQKKIVIYHTPKKLVIDFIDGHQYAFLDNSQQKSDAGFVNYFLQPTRLKYHAFESIQPNDVPFKNGLIQFCHHKLLIINASSSLVNYYPNRNIDIVLLSKNPNVNFEALHHSFRPRYFVFDASNSLWKIAKWKKECSALHLHYFSIPDDGAITYDLKNNTISASKNLKQK
jgi:competence protein ComEC